MQRGLDDRICFSMNGADAMTFHHQVTDFIAMFLPSWRAVEAGGENAFIKDKHRANESPVSCTALGYPISDFHEVGIPIRPHIFSKRKRQSHCVTVSEILFHSDAFCKVPGLVNIQSSDRGDVICQKL